jgi:hypothetical protein
VDARDCEIKGIRIAAVDVLQACSIIGERAPTARGDYVTVTGAHGSLRRSMTTRIMVAHLGLSTPKQEVWMHMQMPKIGRGVALGVGEAFDLLSGALDPALRL